MSNETQLRTQSAEAKRPLIGVRILDPAADMKTQADLVAGPVHVGEFHASAGPAPNFFDSS